MRSVVGLTALWLVFGGMHIGLATCRVRDGLVSRLGERGFLALFSLIAAVSFSVLVHYYTLHRFDGPPGLALGAAPALRRTLMAVVVAGIVLIAASLVVYPRSPMALFNATVRAPRGIERVTRHAFFVGVALLGAAHALLATRLVGTVLMGGLAVVAGAGAWHQDRKLLRRRGEPYADISRRRPRCPSERSSRAASGSHRRSCPSARSPSASSSPSCCGRSTGRSSRTAARG